MDLDDILKPDNLNDKEPEKEKKKNAVKSRLDDLKEMLKSDPVQLDTSDLLANTDAFPTSQQAKYIDYDEEKKNHKEYAEQAITNIITTYIKSVKLLESPRLKDLKQNDVMKYSRLLLLLQISEANLIRLQESIDGGDMMKEMFDSVNKAQQEYRANMTAFDQHIAKCEKYWKEYADIYGFENEEEKIVQETEEKSETEEKHTIIDMSKLTEIIHQRFEDEKDNLRKKE